MIVLSDRNSTATLAPIPSLLLVAAVHHHLVRDKTRTRVGLVIESGDAREVHHMALLKGFGAAAINPYLAFETIDDMIALGGPDRRDRPPGAEELHQGRVQGHHQGDVQDGHLDGGLLYRGPGVRGGRPGRRGRRRVLHRHGVPHRRCRARRPGRGGGRPPPPVPPGPARPSWPTASGRWAASTSGAGRARSTSSTRRPCSSCSTPPGPSATRCSRSTPGRSTTSRPTWPPCGG